jgi:hypothetical protein
MFMMAKLIAQRLNLLIGGKSSRHSQDYKERSVSGRSSSFDRARRRTGDAVLSEKGVLPLPQEVLKVFETNALSPG